ncbi:MAG: NTP transferase domain-containing protein [Alphaproteobacteria bacterium]|nr:NTP transferase domain-containing protein [Alphaproteobacteria bacterium]MDA7988086.1 NTP transferase domain-containing protein [Alphaproteobacteria bacterium]
MSVSSAESLPRAGVVLLAAGRSRRIRASRSKLLLDIAGLPVVAWTARATLALEPARVLAVISPDGEGEGVAAALSDVVDADTFNSVVQDEPLGTGHAARRALSELENTLAPGDDVFLIVGDAPCVRGETLVKLRDARGDADSAWLAFRPDDPAAYGRFVLDGSDSEYAARIVELKNLRDGDAVSPLVWSGVMVTTLGNLSRYLPMLDDDNRQGEFLLTDIIIHAARDGGRARIVECDAEDGQGVNTRADHALAEEIIQGRLRAAAMAGGAGLVAPGFVFLSHDTCLGEDCRIEPWVWFGGGVEVEGGAVIRSFSHLEGVRVGRGASVGPFARLRPGTVLGEGVRVGNFAEVKASRLGDGVRAGHFSYIGDSVVGNDTNIGAGVVTCNYDGFGKHQTHIGAGSFIGSNSALIAPVSVGGGAVVGAGSVITDDVPDDALAVARAETSMTENGAAARRSRKKK